MPQPKAAVTVTVTIRNSKGMLVWKSIPVPVDEDGTPIPAILSIAYQQAKSEVRNQQLAEKQVVQDD